MGETISLRDLSGRELVLVHPFRLSAHSGLGPPAPRLGALRETYRSGQRTVVSLWEARVLQLTLEVTPAPFQELSALRDVLNGFLAQIQPGVFVRVQRTDGAIFEGSFRLGAELAQAREAISGHGWQRIVLTLVSDDAWWFGVSQVWTVGVARGLGEWGFPLGFPRGFGTSGIDHLEIQQYRGQVDTFPVITVRGPARDLVIRNLSLNMVLDLSTYVIVPGEVVTIDLRETHKTITTTKAAGTLLPYLSEESHLGAWRIGAHPVPINGDNRISVHMTDATIETSLMMAYRERYIGI